MVEEKKDARNLSGFAKDHGIKTFWNCWESGRWFGEQMAIIEVCKRIEAIELQLKEKDK